MNVHIGPSWAYTPGGSLHDEMQLPRSAKFISVLCGDWDYRQWTLVLAAQSDARGGSIPALTVRMRHNDGRAWAVWRDGKFSAAQIMRQGDIARNAKVRDIKAWLLEFPGSEKRGDDTC